MCFGFFFCRLSQYISLHHTSSDFENKIMPGSWVYVHAMTSVNQIYMLNLTDLKCTWWMFIYIFSP